MMVDTSKVYITDKTGKKFYNTICATAFVDAEIRGLQKQLISAKKNPELYHFLDLETATIETELYDVYGDNHEVG